MSVGDGLGDNQLLYSNGRRSTWEPDARLLGIDRVTLHNRLRKPGADIE